MGDRGKATLVAAITGTLALASVPTWTDAARSGGGGCRP
jgi:hypothetical protein